VRGLEEKLDYAQETLAADDPLLLWMTFLKHPERITEDIISQIPEMGVAMTEPGRLSRDRDFAESWDEWRWLVDRRFDLVEGMEGGREKNMRKARGQMDASR
ncbi:MAG: hypothetical protein LBU15_01510, partial [Rickettsiales bacterium]|jgi:hypothetical protein|nr:hypothetical protein [Rickettsiales bacterium]